MSYMKNSNAKTIYLELVTENEVSAIVNSLKISSTGWDDISSKVIKKTYKSFIKPLTYLYNISINTGIFPDELKIAKVIPIYKSKEKYIFSNYRPISILPTFSKILERLMYNRLIIFINKYNILYKYQFGFRKNHSTSMAKNIRSTTKQTICARGVLRFI